MKMLSIGDINLDIITPKISYFPLKDEQLIVDHFKWFIGGGATITACAANSLGLETTLVGCVGDDLVGKMLLNKINKLNVKTKIRKTTTPTEITFAVTFENTSRSFITTIGANKELIIKDIPSLNGYNHLHLSSFYHLRSLQKNIESLFIKARNEGLTISFDPGFIAGANPSLVKKLLPLIDILFVNELELKTFGGSQYCSKKVPIIAVHSGSKGSIVYTKGKKIISPPLKVKVINPTGAGDVYNAGFLKSFLKGEPIESNLKKAVKASTYYIKQKEQKFPTIKKQKKIK